MAKTREQLKQMGASIKERFHAEKRLLSFEEYLDLFSAHPWRHSRDAARYLRDCFDHYGTYQVERPWGKITRWRLFDLEFEQELAASRRRELLVGHERLQAEFYRSLGNFVREGRANRLLLLHGPNGSAKSTFANCLMRASEHYSQTDDGAVYRFSWVFPRGKDGKVIGFGSTDIELEPMTSYAHLDEGKVDVKLTSELREHPLLLLPLAERRALISEAYAERGVTEAAPDWLWNGQLGQKNRDIFTALLTAHGGDLLKTLAHVQVERYYISKRYRTGVVTIGPQMSVDAVERQITADRSLGSLPASLSALALFETSGELVDGAAGLIEYSDLLTRPLDAWKYLLLAIETGEVALHQSIMPVNSVLMASSNELHLNAFRDHHEYKSFRGRLQLLRVPYLLDYTQEQRIYDEQIVPQVRGHVAPHSTQVAAMWGVLTRLMRPEADRYESRQLGKVAADLTPMEKLELLAHGTVPGRLSNEEAKELRANIGELVREWEGLGIYEGLTGASPREIRTLLLDAAQHPEFECLSPLAVFDRLDALCEQGDYDFLKQAPEAGYQDHRGFIIQVRERWLDLVDDELRTASGLVEEAQYQDLFNRYVTHVSLWVKKERYHNPITGQYEDPDAVLMRNIEDLLEVEESEDFRHNMINSVAAHAIDHPGEKMEYARVFPRYMDRVKQAYFGERRKQIAGLIEYMLAVLGNEDGIHTLDREEHEAALRALQRLKTEYGYCDACARDVLGELLKRRYTA